jgi:hypothetical protein
MISNVENDEQNYQHLVSLAKVLDKIRNNNELDGLIEMLGAAIKNENVSVVNLITTLFPKMIQDLTSCDKSNRFDSTFKHALDTIGKFASPKFICQIFNDDYFKVIRYTIMEQIFKFDRADVLEYCQQQRKLKGGEHDIIEELSHLYYDDSIGTTTKIATLGGIKIIKFVYNAGKVTDDKIFFGYSAYPGTTLKMLMTRTVDGKIREQDIEDLFEQTIIPCIINESESNYKKSIKFQNLVYRNTFSSLRLFRFFLDKIQAFEKSVENDEDNTGEIHQRPIEELVKHQTDTTIIGWLLKKHNRFLKPFNFLSSYNCGEFLETFMTEDKIETFSFLLTAMFEEVDRNFPNDDEDRQNKLIIRYNLIKQFFMYESNGNYLTRWNQLFRLYIRNKNLFSDNIRTSYFNSSEDVDFLTIIREVETCHTFLKNEIHLYIPCSPLVDIILLGF